MKLSLVKGRTREEDGAVDSEAGAKASEEALSSLRSDNCKVRPFVLDDHQFAPCCIGICGMSLYILLS